MYLFATNSTDLFKRVYKANSNASWISNPDTGIKIVTTPEQLKRLIPKVESDNEAELKRQLDFINKNGLKC